jgi:hypothetical protein
VNPEVPGSLDESRDIWPAAPTVGIPAPSSTTSPALSPLASAETSLDTSTNAFRGASRVALRVAFVIVALTVAHDLAGIRDADAPYAVDDVFVYRLFAASRAAMLAVAATLLAPETTAPRAQWLGIALLGLAANNDWFTYAPDDLFFWPVAIADYAGVAVAMAGFIAYVLARTVAVAPAALLRGATVAAVLLAAVGVALPVFTFGPLYEPVLAVRANLAYWALTIAACASLVVFCATALVRQRTEFARTARGVRTSRATLAAFVVLGVGTTVHGLARIGQAGAEPWLPAGIDALCQCVFAALLAIVAFREPRPALARAARWIGFGGAIAALIPLADTALHDRALEWHLDRIGAFGGEANGRMLLTIGTGLIFSRIDKALDTFRKNAVPETAETAAPAETATLPPSDGGALPSKASLEAFRCEIVALHEKINALYDEVAALRTLLEPIVISLNAPPVFREISLPDTRRQAPSDDCA